jgi:FixJ family two-component response regulator
MEIERGIPSTRNILVIVVDDDSAVRNSLKFSLEIEGFAVRSYASAADLLDAPRLEDCACYIIDQKMPGMNGLDLIARLRERHISAPAILVTTNPDIMVKERAKRANIRIVEKPLLGNALMENIRAACQPNNGSLH